MAGGTPASGESCGEQPEPVKPTTPPLPCTPGETYLAHAPLASDLPFEVPRKKVNGGDNTVCFTFVRPEGAPALATGWGPVLGDESVIHHISLFATTEPIQDGGLGPCRWKNATYLMGWEPGRGNSMLPPDVGLELPAKGARGIILEVHYHNARDVQTADASGMAICTTDTPRPNVAGVLTLGTENIVVPARQDALAVGLCPATVTAALSEPLHVLSTAPHMHLTGQSLQTEVVHADGSFELLAPPDPWDPHRQPLYQHTPPAEIRPGDTLRTICRYHNDGDRPVLFGSRATDEMCYGYNVVYPISALPPALANAPLRLCDCPAGAPCALAPDDPGKTAP
jgi:hypothetical protein